MIPRLRGCEKERESVNCREKNFFFFLAEEEKRRKLLSFYLLSLSLSPITFLLSLARGDKVRPSVLELTASRKERERKCIHRVGKKKRERAWIIEENMALIKFGVTTR